MSLICPHENFYYLAKIERVTDVEGETVILYDANVSIICEDCKEEFVFIGLPGGYDPEKPTVNFYATEARLPIRPSSDYPVNSPAMVLPLIHRENRS